MVNEAGNGVDKRMAKETKSSSRIWANSNSPPTSLQVVWGGISQLTRHELFAMSGLFALAVIVGLMEGAVIGFVPILVQALLQPSLLEESRAFAWMQANLGVPDLYESFPALAAIVATIIMTVALSNILLMWLTEVHGAQCQVRLAHRITKSIFAASYAWHASQNSSVLARHIHNDISRWRKDFLQSLMLFVQSVFMILVPLAVVVLMDPPGAVFLVLAVGGCVAALGFALRPMLHRNSRRQKDKINSVFRVLSQSLAGTRELKLSNAIPAALTHLRRMQLEAGRLGAVSKVLTQTPAILIASIGQISFLAVSYVFWLQDVSATVITSQLAMLAILISRVLPALAKSVTAVNTLIGSLPWVEGLLHLIKTSGATHSSKRDAEGRRVPANWTAIDLSDVSYRHDGSEGGAGIYNVSMRLERGKRYGVVGPSGAGKTTLVNVLLGLFKPHFGSISVGSVPLDAIAAKYWWERCAYVPQAPFMIDDTLAANVAIGNEHIDTDRLKRALDAAALGDFHTPEIPATRRPIGERGQLLSGGQVQRVAIARALYRDPDLLVLDEATSALDQVTAVEVMARLKSYRPDAVAVIIAHDVELVRDCERIFLMVDGTINDHGSYDELMTRNVVFRGLAGYSGEAFTSHGAGESV